MNRIRPLTDVEKKCFLKYRAQLATVEAEAARLREFIGDMAIAFSGREAPVQINELGLFELETKK